MCSSAEKKINMRFVYFQVETHTVQVCSRVHISHVVTFTHINQRHTSDFLVELSLNVSLGRRHTHLNHIIPTTGQSWSVNHHGKNA